MEGADPLLRGERQLGLGGERHDGFPQVRRRDIAGCGVQARSSPSA